MKEKILVGIFRRLMVVGLMTAVGEAAAQTTAKSAPSNNGNVIDEIVVTAQFRKQYAQQTPIAISAMDSSQMEARGLVSVVDITSAVPNMTIRPGLAAFGPSAQAQIRGVGQYDPSFALEPGVGMYVDDVYYASIFGSIFDLLDLDRVEVLRGPQGTLAGKNSIGGAVKLYSQKPSGSNDGAIEATTGRYRRIDVRGSGDFALVPDKLFVRLAAVSRNRDGYITRKDFVCDNPGIAGPGFPTQGTSGDCKIGTLGGQKMSAVRASARLIINDAMEDTFIADHTEDKSEAGAQTLVVADRARPGAPVLPPVTVGGVTYGSIFIPSDRFVSYATFSNPTDPYGSYTLPKVSGVNATGYSNSFDWKINSDFSFRYIAAYRTYNGAFSTDTDGSPLGITNVYTTMDQTQKSHELRLNGHFGDLVEWTVGAYYLKTDGVTGGRKNTNTLVTTARGLMLDFLDNDTAISTSKSAFAHTVWHLSDKMTLTTGARHTSESKDYFYQRRNPDGTTPVVCTPFIPALCPINSTVAALNGRSGSYSGSRWDYRVSMDYRWTPDVMTFAQWSTGFKGGGINPRPFTAAQVQPFGPETMGAYEVGFKSVMLDRRMRVNGSVFRNNYKSVQTTLTAAATCNSLLSDNASACAMPINGGDAIVKGAELELELRPINGLLIDASASWLNFRYTRVAAGTGITIGMVTPNTPTHKSSLGIQYRFETNYGSLTPRVDADFQSKIFATPVNTSVTETQGRTVTNARLTWKSLSGDWQATLAVTNLFDRFYYVNKFDSYSLAGVVMGQPARPREWSLNIKRFF